MMKIRIGTRGSNLAVAQTDHVISLIESLNKDIEIEKVIINTKGDKILDKSLDKIGDKGLFVKEIENALLDKTIDLAIHSMKDMPTEMPEGLILVDPPLREEAWDVLVLREGYKSIDDIPNGGIIGTGSKRRAYQLLQLRPDIKIVPIRGNINTRMRKIETENLDGTILAKAGLNRIGFSGENIYEFDLSEMIPAPCQGILGLQCREEDVELIKILDGLKDDLTTRQFEIERSFLKSLNGSCHVPMGCYAEFVEDGLTIHGVYGDADGKVIIKKSVQSNLKDGIKDASELARNLAEEINI